MDPVHFLIYKPAIETKRCIFLSERFRQGHKQFTELICKGADKPGSKWRILPSKELFVAVHAGNTKGPVRQHPVMDALAVVMPVETQADEFKNLRNALVAKQFIKFSQKVVQANFGVATSLARASGNKS